VCKRFANSLTPIRRNECDARLRILEDEANLARMEPGIHRHCGEARPPGGVKDLEILGHVAHDERDAIARREPETGTHHAGKARDAMGELAIPSPRRFAQEDGGARRIGAARAGEPVGAVHGNGVVTIDGPSLPLSKS
jgi:hypothetical protein